MGFAAIVVSLLVLLAYGSVACSVGGEYRPKATGGRRNLCVVLTLGTLVGAVSGLPAAAADARPADGLQRSFHCNVSQKLVHGYDRISSSVGLSQTDPNSLAVTTSAGTASATSRSSRIASHAYDSGQLLRVSHTSMATNTPVPESGTVYRTGSRTDAALTDPTGVSFRESISSSADRVQVFKAGDKIYAVDTAKLPPGSVIRDGVPNGHVSINATPEQIRAAVIDDPNLSGSGLKKMDDGSYRLPK